MLAALPAAGEAAPAAPLGGHAAATATTTPQSAVRIVAVVNGDVISNVDVDDRAGCLRYRPGSR